MKIFIILLMSLTLFACASAHRTRTPEVVASCFSEGDDQEKVCKSQRLNDDGKTVITRCIGAKNSEAHPNLRGKCVEKICSEGSNTDCQIRGEMGVLQQYAELMTSGMFSSDDEPAPAKKTSSSPSPAPVKAPAVAKTKAKGKKSSKSSPAPAPEASATPAGPVAEVSTDPSVLVPPLPTPVEKATPPPPPARTLAATEPEEAPAVFLTLKPAKPLKTPKAAKSKSRSPSLHASESAENGFKRVCISKAEAAAPKNLRGKCATRSCSQGKCTYKGRKEMFDWVASRGDEPG